MTTNTPRLELTWIGKENRPPLEPRFLIEESGKSQDAIDEQRQELIGKLEGQLKQRTHEKSVINTRWRLG